MKSDNFIGLYGGPFDGDKVLRPDKHQAIAPRISKRQCTNPPTNDVYVYCEAKDEYVWERMLEGAAA